MASAAATPPAAVSTGSDLSSPAKSTRPAARPRAFVHVGRFSLIDCLSMLIGACLVELRIEGSRSLKDRRRVVHRIKSRLRSKFNASVREVEADNTWTGARIGIAVVAEGRSDAEALLHKILNHIERLEPGVVADYELQIY